MLLKKTTLALASIGALASSSTCFAGAMAAEPAKAELTMAPQYALSWPKDLGKVDLFVAPVPDQTKMTPVRRNISETAMTLVSPLPGTTRAYFFIKPENGKPGIWVSNRVLPTQAWPISATWAAMRPRTTIMCAGGVLSLCRSERSDSERLRLCRYIGHQERYRSAHAGRAEKAAHAMAGRKPRFLPFGKTGLAIGYDRSKPFIDHERRSSEGADGDILCTDARLLRA